MIRAGAMEEDGIPRQAEWERRERERGGGGGREGKRRQRYQIYKWAQI